ncbi:S1 family peptidase [Pseudoduganella sp. GCM10020061]|uniref:S1 family peptidase n=1 Tax=Pseudoduganella sp. GCM10020061 TaxID=3317345 RepID=UPI003635D6C3
MVSLPKFAACALLLCFGIPASAVVVRHDVDEAKYRAKESAIPALADMPGEGHGVLIAPRWVVTAAHAITWQHQPISEIVLLGKPRSVKRVVIHAGYKPMPHVPSKGDIAPFMKFITDRDDIALIELHEAVTDVEPLPLYRATDEAGKRVTFYGKGATGDGIKGLSPHAPHRTVLRMGANQVSAVVGHWLEFSFDNGPDALPLEAFTGGGDSGGPLLIESEGRRWLAGLASHAVCEGDIADCQPGFYGSRGRQVRISAYADWIERTIQSK